jgi:radical SAM protein with 4Fe4S-binding SPASM domain
MISKHKAATMAVLNYLRKNDFCNNPPIRVWVEPTNQCNLKCMSCANMLIKDKGFMDLNLFKKIIDQLSGYAFEIYLYMSGESLLHPKIVEMINYAKKKNLFVNISTNGTTLNNSLSKDILSTKLDKMTLSLDTFDKYNYESNRLGAKHEEVINNIIHFLKLKRAHKSKIEVSIRLSELYKKNSRKGKYIERKLINLGAKINTHHTHDWCGKIDLPLKYSKKSYFHCFHSYAGLSIQWNGNVVPCCRDFFGEYILGNVNQSSIKEIWNNKRSRKLRRMLIHKKYKDVKLCKDCDMLWGKKVFGFPLKILKSYIKCRE